MSDLIESMKSTLLVYVLCSKGVTVRIIKQVLNLVITLTISRGENQGGGVRQGVTSKHCHCQVLLCAVRLGGDLKTLSLSGVTVWSQAGSKLWTLSLLGVRLGMTSRYCHFQVTLRGVRMGMTSKYCHCKVSGMAANTKSLLLLQRSHWDEWRLWGPSFMQIAEDRAWVGSGQIHSLGQYYSDISLSLTILLRHITVFHNITQTYHCLEKYYPDISPLLAI